jgi:hypothetical protein
MPEGITALPTYSWAFSPNTPERWENSILGDRSYKIF